VDDGMGETLNRFYDAMHDPVTMEFVLAYDERHGINSAAILTLTDDEKAALVASHLAERVRGKTVVELGGGIGLLALHLSPVAKRVIVIEANPVWTEVFVALLYRMKPKNVTWVFGVADEVATMVRGDVALYCTHSDHDGMRAVASRLAPEVIDVYPDLLGADYWRRWSAARGEAEDILRREGRADA
jgi:hypothetical protein